MPFVRASLNWDSVQGKKKKTQEQSLAQDYVPAPPAMPGDEAFSMPIREIVKPDNQLRLTEGDLQEEVAKMLTANNPAAPKNIVRFNMKDKVFKLEPMVEQTVVHYATDGWLLHKSSDEAKRQMDMEKMEQEASARFQADIDRASHEHKEHGDVEPPDDSRQLRNQFNFSERAAQTLNYPLRDRETFTEPPPTATISGTSTQWEIFDEYIKDLERQRLDEAAKIRGGKKHHSSLGVLAKSSNVPTLQSPVLSHSLGTLDRMVNQNMYEEVAMDFKYWDDASDAFRPGEGSLLPLWKFASEKSKRRQVTSICWNPLYDDMFAVGYGSYEFLKQASGLINIYSLKNPSHPEYTFNTESGVMSVDFHPEFANLLAVGCYDGTVLVYDVRLKKDAPIYQATVRTGKHNDPVWQVYWQVDEGSKALQFVSISSDGSVNLWTLTKSELIPECLMKLRVVQEGAEPSEDDPAASGPAGGCCMDFCKMPGQDSIYLVGTEEGAIHRCSKAYSSQYLNTYLAHHLAVYAVNWNRVHPSMFLSSSADWTVKLWDVHDPKRPVMSFDLNDSIGDVAWAPYSATVFAAITDDGRVHVFDLAQNKLLPLCSQKVVKKAKLTKMVFNPKQPIVLVGDDKGSVISLKLSPNLRITSKPEKGQKFEDLEVAKLDAVVEIARKSDADLGQH
ncbi:Dynein, intermediate chain, flagellar outer arm [Tetrabaena socialis]|uniref:Dynein, intermediate chain, flagellar outer arm n=1 Tax=Tetrabaena socialis TaxID=47790 RepID=A0A2J7ZYP2_9CHLO|nr:Dynein, intermediate chain, flagellar outer arm [Tetrabaena socialis]|eukprot:PNH05389.1 Dynein, intermediate chain, flagellar outer arm [Tetrabaena socialis]